MDRLEGQPKFEIRPIIEQKPFESSIVQSFFTKWCEINDSIQPQFVTREQWNSRGTKGILEKRQDGGQTLFIPKDLHIWEMMGVIEVVDKDTFTSKPEKTTEIKEKIMLLGRNFENAGIYIAQRLNIIGQGREIAQTIATEFYQYGHSLINGKNHEMANIDEISLRNLTPQETETIDRFLAGDMLYKLRRKRVENLAGKDQTKDVSYEVERQKTLAQFFRITKKAFLLEYKSAEGQLKENPSKLKPWQSKNPIHKEFLRKIEAALKEQIETPKQELNMAIFQRGLEKLIEDMKMHDWKHFANRFFKIIGLNIQIEQKKLFEKLKTTQNRSELETLRREGKPETIVLKEREIADKIQKAVSSFPYRKDSNNPVDMVVNHHINCVAASNFGGVLMKESGLNYLVVSMPTHSILLLVTSDGKVEWRDMLNASFNKELTDEMIVGSRADGEPLTVADIVAFSKKPSQERPVFDFVDPIIPKRFTSLREQLKEQIIVLEPENGQLIQILGNLRATFVSLGRKEEGLEVCRQIIAIDPKNAENYFQLGISLSSLDRNEEAIEVFRQAIVINPKHNRAYYFLGTTLECLDRKREAFDTYKEAIKVNKKYPLPYLRLSIILSSLGDIKEAMWFYKIYKLTSGMEKSIRKYKE